MGLSIISFTKKGMCLAERILECLGREEAAVFTKCSFKTEVSTGYAVQFVKQGLSEWTKEQMKEKNSLLFIGACGIAVRAIAPWITDKLNDNPVLVMDENGEYVIPILSGHMGGANELAIKIAEKTGAIPVITTATDLQGKFAVDLFAKKNGLHIVNKDGIAKVSSKVLAGKEITMSIETDHIREGIKLPDGIRLLPYPPEQNVDVVITTEEKKIDAQIWLKPRVYSIGMGCKKGKETEKIEALIDKSMEKAGITKKQVFAFASIDRKKEEKGFLVWCQKEKIPFLTFSAEQLQEIEGNFNASAFVKEQVGVDNVCERAALKACGTDGKIIYQKHAEDGMTIAIAKRDWRVVFDEE